MNREEITQGLDKVVRLCLLKGGDHNARIKGIEHINDAITLLNQSPWISMSDRKPTNEDADKKRQVLAVYQDGYCEVLEYDDYEFNGHPHPPTHWMPIPEPPKNQA